uniref:Uncharacterized protein n=1 Tax=Aegilops tauschii TaxID=37682 RepID=M8BQP2_AEGTA
METSLGKKLRENNLRGCCEEMEDDYPDNRPDYLHGGNPQPCSSSGDECQEIAREAKKVQIAKWVANIAANGGSILCPPAELGGCGRPGLELRRLFPEDWLTRLEAAATALKLFLPTSDVTLQCQMTSSTSRITG